MEKIQKKIIFSCLITLFYGLVGHSAVFTVNTTADGFGAPAAGTIRWAIQQVNAAGAGSHTINFTGLAGVGPFTFNLVSPLEDLTHADVTIDGSTASGYSCAAGIPQIVIVGVGFNQFEVSGANCVIRAISFRTHKVDLLASGITIQGCWFNLNDNGTAGAGGTPGNNFLVLNGCVSCIVGGTGCGQRNIISGFAGGGMATGNILITASSSTQFINNYIGTDITGMTALNNNVAEGIQLNNSNNIMIDGNVISACKGDTPDGFGINILSGTTNNLTIQNNKIGVNSAGGIDITHGNDKAGISLRTPSTGLLIQNNIICSNGRYSATGNQAYDSGIAIDASGAATGSILNNHIGVNTSYALGGNKFYGIYLYDNANGIIIRGNVLGDNGDNADPARYGGGITAAVNPSNTNITIAANYIGVAPNGANIGNHNNGIHLESGPSNIMIGGAAVADRNYIGFNKGKRTSGNGGIFVFACLDVTILNNYIGLGPTGTACGQLNAGGHALGGNGVFVQNTAGTTTRTRVGNMTAQNIIANNAGNGINVYRADFVEMRWNSMYCNTEKAIDINCGVDQGNNGFGCPAAFTVVGVGATPYVSLTGAKPANSLVDVYGTNLCAPATGSCFPQSQYRYGGTAADATLTWTYNNGTAMYDDLSAATTGMPGTANCTGVGVVCRTSELLCVDNPLLPVSFFSFTGKKQELEIYLNWQTGFEKDNAYFNIERSSDGKTFETIGTVTGEGNSTQLLSYNYTDYPSSEHSVLYYRLKQVDYDGLFSYSEIISINNDHEGLIKVFPNPGNGYFNIVFKNTEFKSADISVIDITSKEVYHSAIGNNQNELVKITLESILPGAYMLIIKTDTDVYTEKIFVE